MSQPVNLGNKTYNRLKYVKEKMNFRSFTVVVEHLLDNYWSPALEDVQIEEQFHDLISWLRLRNLVDEDVEGGLAIVHQRVIKAKKEKRIAPGKRPHF